MLHENRNILDGTMHLDVERNDEDGHWSNLNVLEPKISWRMRDYRRRVMITLDTSILIYRLDIIFSCKLLTSEISRLHNARSTEVSDSKYEVRGGVLRTDHDGFDSDGNVNAFDFKFT